MEANKLKYVSIVFGEAVVAIDNNNVKRYTALMFSEDVTSEDISIMFDKSVPDKWSGEDVITFHIDEDMIIVNHVGCELYVRSNEAEYDIVLSIAKSVASGSVLALSDLTAMLTEAELFYDPS